MQIIALANKYNIPTIVDSKEDIYKYKGCTVIKPNKDEAYSLLNINTDIELSVVHEQILHDIQSDYSIVTLADEGISIKSQSGVFIDKYQGTLNVIDPIGGGDIVTCIIAFFFNKLSIEDSIHIAVNMASKSVEKTGVISISKKDIINFFFPTKIINSKYLPIFRVLPLSAYIKTP